MAVAVVHSDNRLVAVIAVGIFAAGVAASVMLIASTTGRSPQISVGPDPLLQVVPAAETSR